LLSRSGIIPISSTQDTAGPLARTVKDAAILLGALTGEDPSDTITSQSKGKVQADYTKFLDAGALKGKNIGVDLKKKSVNQYMNRLLREAIEVLKKAGANIIEIEYVSKIEELGNHELLIMQYEFKDGLNSYLSNTNHKIKTLKEVIDFNNVNEDKAMPYFKQEQLEICEKKGGLESKEYKEALVKGRDASRKILDDLITEHKLDAIAGLTMGPACSIDTIYGDRWGNDFLTQPAAMSGYPHISLPCGMIYNLPVGLSLFAGAYTEPQLIAMAYAYEQLSKKRIAPTFIKTFLA